MKNAFRLLLLAIVIFLISCLISFFLSFEQGSNFSVGFPYKFYHEFQVSGNPYRNHGGDYKKLFLDIGYSVLAAGFILVGYKLFKNRRAE